MSDIKTPVTSRRRNLFPLERYLRARILVVDDINLNVKLICSRLNAAGFTNLDTASDGLEAVTKTCQHRPDLVLLDLMMPNMDGFGYCEHIRADPSAFNMPIIVQTALEDSETKIRALAAGADDFLNKPLDLDEVALRVFVHLERYFMLYDLQGVQRYLQAELDEAQAKIRALGGVSNHSGSSLLETHQSLVEAFDLSGRA